jgi:hypothetical protein
MAAKSPGAAIGRPVSLPYAGVNPAATTGGAAIPYPISVSEGAAG